MRKITGLIMVVIALFFLFLIGKGLFSLPKTNGQLAEAVFIEDGIVRPENEGKLVIVMSSLDVASNAYDDELGLSLPSPVAIRFVEEFAVTGEKDDWQKTWNPVSESSKDWLKRKSILGEAAMGEFSVSERLLRCFPAGRELSLSQLDPDEVAALEEYVRATVSDGVLYFTEAPDACFYSGPADEFYFDYEGLRRVHYRYLDLDPDDTFAVAGIQQGNQIAWADDLDTHPVYEDAHSKADVILQTNLYTILGMLLVGIVCVALLFIGVWWLKE